MVKWALDAYVREWEEKWPVKKQDLNIGAKSDLIPWNSCNLLFIDLVLLDFWKRCLFHTILVSSYFSLSSFLCLLSALGRNQKFHIFHFVFRFINFIINSLSIKHCHLFILHSSSEEIRPVLRTFSHFGFFLLFLLFFLFIKYLFFIWLYWVLAAAWGPSLFLLQHMDLQL